MPSRERLQAAAPDVIIESLAELADLVARWSAESG
jgi:hypothetical protein